MLRCLRYAIARFQTATSVRNRPYVDRDGGPSGEVPYDPVVPSGDCKIGRGLRNTVQRSVSVAGGNGSLAPDVGHREDVVEEVEGVLGAGVGFGVVLAGDDVVLDAV